ncbi:NAD-dependent epimerase/dehydratase family protein [Sphingobacterium daejeonense]|uniref:NAD-dependent epimerase/dehydratase family protein n=1 Tax=Sphingobacterium daejeonense TaxID=371142 RepID=UPI0010C2CC69|nr:NAD-dependent epimerase/dehydratase family protein [Sphingobacterium daejeonense]VTQ00061.1 UDP-glucose 4-epimerase [Sphingobacterium daejeonense]
MNIAIVGGSGFVGTKLISNLLDTPSLNLVNIDRQQSSTYPQLTKIANVLDKSKLTELLKGQDVVVLLAAEHRDDVSPTSLYYDVNVQGMRNTLEAMEANGVSRLVFTSSVAVYGLDKDNPDESFPADAFNHYGKSKWEAEQVLQEWNKTHSDWNINVIRPTVIFGGREQR